MSRRDTPKCHAVSHGYYTTRHITSEYTRRQLRVLRVLARCAKPCELTDKPKGKNE